ncbi:PocR sensory domain-containing protein [Clostridium sp. USBA 49]|uniref:helix-turn-helix domain-containing protein n=1 Tax=Clostridium sp. USBA 49 TaxID=1881060 RepID=UPI00099ADA97|nr:helix-turn-helix domain-containing protein [Clostridium sp. USBA 49]SKA82529.1 PocR sensory domain-containing protein [Clostridium sp. USBA 49]
MSQLEDVIKRLCKFALNFSNIDTFFINSMSNIKFEYSYNKLPKSLTPYFSNIINMLKLNEPASKYNVIFHSNSYRLNFISAKIYNGNDYLGSILVGPFLLEEPTVLMIEAVISENNMAISLKNLLKQYYLSLPMISAYKAKTIAEFLFYLISTFRYDCFEEPKIGNLTYDFKTEYIVSRDMIKENTERTIEIIEKRYNIENAFLHAVESGNRELLEDIVNESNSIFSKIPDRVPNDPLRSRKNLSFVLNTLLRKAAERGGVHPIYIDSISEKYAVQIERCTSINQIIELNNSMYFGYCDAVRKLSTKNFSPLVRKAIDYIRINLNQDLSLESISSAIHSNAYDLSRQFKKETGETITEYINKKRINEAIYILENENVSITDAAYTVGFNDVNYFTKVFKKIKGVTPSKFRKIKNN